MIVFYYVLISIILVILISIIILLLSLITVELTDFDIDSIEKVVGIATMLENERYEKVMDYVNVNIKLNIWLFNFIPIRILKLNNKKLKRIIEKIIIKQQKERRKNEIKFIVKQNRIKEFVKNFFKLIYPDMKMKKIKLYMNVSLSDACATAICTSILNIVLGIITSYIYNRNYENTKNAMDYYKVVINPIYSKELKFSVDCKFKLSLKIFSIMKEIFMNKSILFVNNTNKYNVKES